MTRAGKSRLTRGQQAYQALAPEGGAPPRAPRMAAAWDQRAAAPPKPWRTARARRPLGPHSALRLRAPSYTAAPLSAPQAHWTAGRGLGLCSASAPRSAACPRAPVDLALGPSARLSLHLGCARQPPCGGGAIVGARLRDSATAPRMPSQAAARRPPKTWGPALPRDTTSTARTPACGRALRCGACRRAASAQTAQSSRHG